MAKMKIPHVSEDETEVSGNADRFTFEWAEMYKPPNLSYKILRDLSEFFGTEKIDTSDNISESGCETCDYGSRYGFRVIVEEATKNNPFK